MGSATYYSNCLIEALRAKFKDPKNVKLCVGWEPWTRRKFWGFHAWWEINSIEHDFKPTVVITWANYWWHKGQIRSCGVEDGDG